MSENNRFVFISSEKLNSLKEETLAENSKRKATWATNVFNTWLNERQKNGLINGLHVFKPLKDMTKSKLNSQLEFFIFEVRKQNGGRYPRNSLRDLFQGIGYYMSQIQQQECHIFSDPEFFSSRAALDSAMKLANKDGVVPEGNGSATPISANDEEKLWEQNILGDSNPAQLLHTIFFTSEYFLH